MKWCLALAVVVSLCATSLAAAQAANDGSIRGYVRDAQGAVVAGAAVMVIGPTGATPHTAVSDAEGYYQLTPLPPGAYTLTAELAGFAKYVRENIVVRPSANLAVEIVLQVGGVGENVVVTAQKRGEERIQDVPVPVSVVDATRLSDTGQVLLRDYAHTVPGFNVTPNFVATQNLSIRGITTGGLTTPTVGVMIDDVPFGLSSGPNANAVPDVDPGDLARIEVLRGPQGTLYGADSMGGLLKFVTVDPSTAGLTGRIELGTSSVYNGPEPGFRMRASANIPISDTLAIRTSGFVRQDPGYIDNPELHIDGVNEKQGGGARIAVLWRPSRQISLKVNGLYQKDEVKGLDEVVEDPGLVGLQQGYISGVGHQGITMQAYGATLKIERGRLSLTSLTGYNLNENYNSVDWGFSFGPAIQSVFGVTGVPYRGGNRARRITEEIRLAAPLGRRLRWQLGGFYTHETNSGGFVAFGQDTATGQVVGEYWRNTRRGDIFEEYAGFADLTYEVSSRLDIQIGGRESRITNTQSESVQTGPYTTLVLNQPSPVIGPTLTSSASAFTYLVTPRVKLTPDIMVYARLASGYRPGTPNLTTLNVPRQSKPDETRNYEIGLKGDFLGHRLSVDTSLYYIDWQDIQIQARDAVTNFVYQTNGSRAKSQGVELSVAARPATGLSIATWYSYNNAVLTRPLPANSPSFGVPGDRLPLSSRNSGNVSVEQEFAAGRAATAFVGGQVSVVGDRMGTFTNSATRQLFPGYTKTDVRGGVRLDAWTVSVYANNVGDVRGLINGGIGYFYTPARIYITPRTVGVSLSKTF
jgi:iron complex outermembrane receptor protein